MGALELAKAFGLHEVALPEPPGLDAKIRLPSPQELMRKGALPADLRRALLKMRGDEPDADDLDDETIDSAMDASLVRAARMVKALRLDGGEWEPVSLSLDDFIELPTNTKAALIDIATGRKTPRMVDALTRRKFRGELSDDEAAEIVDEEAPKLALHWESFRDRATGSATGADGADVEGQPVAHLPRDHQSGHGVSAG